MSDRILVGTRKGLFTLRRNGGPWAVERVAFLGDRVSMLLSDPERGVVWAALDLGHFGVKLRRSDDGGASFEDCAVPAYPPKPADVEDLDPVRRKPVPWNTELIWALERGGDGRLWCGTIPGGLFRSDDEGASWSLMESLWRRPERGAWFGGGADLPGLHSVCVDPRDPARVLVAVSCGGVWVTPDGGSEWVCRADGMVARFMPPEQQHDPNIQDPHRVVRCPAAPDHLWCQHHNGVWRSTDDAASWQEVTTVVPSSFGFAVAVHPEDPDTAWFVPAVSDEQRVPVDGRVVVARTRDGGRRFEALGKGLPSSHAYDLVFRHALDVDTSGQRLALGSSTGSVWVSEDQGDAFQTVSTHLPPVYCLRFG